MKKQQGLVFISHSPDDKEQKDEITSILENNGYRVWDEVIEIHPGTDWLQEIEKPIRNSKAVLVLITRKSLTSEWVNKEIAYALSLQKNIYSLLLDDVLLLDDIPIPESLRNIQLLDFRKPINETKISKLLQSLRAPFEVFAKSEEALDKYQEDLAKGRQLPINEIKLNIVGQGSVGKTSILRRLVE